MRVRRLGVVRLGLVHLTGHLGDSAVQAVARESRLGSTGTVPVTGHYSLSKKVEQSQMPIRRGRNAPVTLTLSYFISRIFWNVLLQ